MNDEPDQQSDRQLLFIEELIDEHASVAGDILAIDTHTWAIHGTIAVDGEVIMAEFRCLDEAKAALERLSTPNRSTSARSSATPTQPPGRG